MRLFAVLAMLMAVGPGASVNALTTGTGVLAQDPRGTGPVVPPQAAITTTATTHETTATLRTPVYPKAIKGWNVPLGQRDRSPGSVINRFIIHHTTNTGDESPYFKRKNERSSCPTWYVTSDGKVIEFIDPAKRPSSTGKANDYSVAVETQNTSRAPNWGISQESHEALAQIAAWLSQQTHLGPYPVDIKLDRVHIIGHNEAGVNKTVCPGPSMRMDWIVERAKHIVAEQKQAQAPAQPQGQSPVQPRVQ